MHKRRRITVCFVVCLLLCSLSGISTAAYVFSSGDSFSTQTTVSVEGSVNETVFIQITKQNDGIIERNQWISTYTDPNPSSRSWSSHLSIGSVDGGWGWSFQRTGLPVTWNFQRTDLPWIFGKNLPAL